MEEILKEIIFEAYNGKIIIDGDPFPINFNTIIMENNQQIFSNINTKYDYYPTLIIKNEKLLLEQIYKYVTLALQSNIKFSKIINNVEKNKIKLLISYLFVNATTEEFENPISLINKKISFLEDNTFEYLNEPMNIELFDCLQNSNLNIKNVPQSVFMETPNKIEISLNKENTTYQLPSISYGITTTGDIKECYIYSILNSQNNKNESNEQIKFQKQISRELYKLNDGVFNNENDEYKKYKKENDQYYPENISDISPSAIISLTVFISLLKKENINKIKIVPYLPIRFLSRELSSQNFNDEIKRKELESRNDMIQRNITDKFIRTFRRLQYHLNNLEINSYPYEISEYLEMSINNKNCYIENTILNTIYNNTLEKLKQSKKTHI